MGHLLGAAPASTHDVLMQPATTVRRTRHAAEIILQSDSRTHLSGFAIDSPRLNVPYPGEGIEVAGWAIGRTGTVSSIQATVNDDFEIDAPLDVKRPDVLADYPAYPWAARAGFSLWIPIPTEAQNWNIELKARFSDGFSVPIASLRGRRFDDQRVPDSRSRLVSSPDYIILGTQRGGTTSLFRYLGTHPDVRNPTKKEPHFLTDRFHRGASWYLGQFPETLLPGEITGEATPYALFHPQSPLRAKVLTPHARFIVLLRDPVERAFSHFQLERSLGVENLSFSDAITAESVRLEGEHRRLQSDPTYVSFNHKHFSYRARGDYAAQLSRWLENFPRDQFLILKSEDLYREPRATMQRVLDFLGLSEFDSGPFEVHNQSADGVWDKPTREKLQQHFAPINARLNEIVDWPELWPQLRDEKSRLFDWT